MGGSPSFPSPFVHYGLADGQDVQVTNSTAAQSRSESVVAINPVNRNNLIAASKKFIDPKKYQFTLGTSWSLDGGRSWGEAGLPLIPGATGMTDPAVAFDSLGNAFLIGEPLRTVIKNGKEDIEGMGMYVYQSSDGGKSWGNPVPLHPDDPTDDKQWIACDVDPGSPYYGNIYGVWGAVSPLRFARSTDHGKTWRGAGVDPKPGTMLAPTTFAPEISVSHDGTVHIVWHQDGGNTISYLRSTNGGDTFEPVQTIVTGVHSLRGHLPVTNGWPHFPHATFRVITLATGCAGPGSIFVVAWSDYREGAARIYLRLSDDAGKTWTGPLGGSPLLPAGSVNMDLHHFHPQLIATGSGVIGCAFYEFGPKGGQYRIDVHLAGSYDGGISFPHQVTVTDKAWDPAVNAPWAHGDPQVTFIGEYFGLDADEKSFAVLWTDTRTQVQELFFDRVATELIKLPDELHGIYARLLGGVASDGGGIAIVGGKVIKIPPRGPAFDLLQAIASLDAAQGIGHASSTEIQRSIFRSIEAIAKGQVRTLGQNSTFK